MMKKTTLHPPHVSVPQHVILQECSGDFLNPEEFHAPEDESSYHKLMTVAEQSLYLGPDGRRFMNWCLDKGEQLAERLVQHGPASLVPEEIRILEAAGEVVKIGESCPALFTRIVMARRRAFFSEKPKKMQEEQERPSTLVRGRKTPRHSAAPIDSLAASMDGMLLIDKSAEIVARLCYLGLARLGPLDFQILLATGEALRRPKRPEKDR